MQYFHGTSEEIQKSGAYAAKSLQLLGELCIPPRPDQGLCPCTPLGAQPPDPSNSPIASYLPKT